MEVSVRHQWILDLKLTKEEAVMIYTALVHWGKVCPTSEDYRFKYKSILNGFKHVLTDDDMRIDSND